MFHEPSFAAPVDIEPYGRPVIYHIPACPFSQRVEVLLDLKEARHLAQLSVVDITKPRPAHITTLTGGSTALPVMRTGRGPLKESLVLLRYFEATLPGPAIARTDAYERAVEDMFVAFESGFTGAGYRLVMNQDAAKRQALTASMDAEYRKLEDFLLAHNPDGIFLFDRFGMAECVFSPILQRFWFLDYYEAFSLAPYPRVRRWREACLAHPATQQVTHDQIVKLYYDYAKGAGNGALLAGRTRSSFTFESDWRTRPMPPRDKYGYSATDDELGLI